jgi:hypothetical protein
MKRSWLAAFGWLAMLYGVTVSSAAADDNCLVAPTASETGCVADLAALTELMRSFNRMYDNEHIADSSRPCTILRQSGIIGSDGVWLNQLSTQDARSCVYRHVRDPLGSICATSGGGKCVSSVASPAQAVAEAVLDAMVPQAHAIGAVIAHQGLCVTKPKQVIAGARAWLSAYIARMTISPGCVNAAAKRPSVEDNSGAPAKNSNQQQPAPPAPPPPGPNEQPAH